MGMGHTPIVVRLHTDGHLVALGPADVIRSAYHGANALHVTSGFAEGDTIRLRSAQRYGDQGWSHYPDAFHAEHPQHGPLIAAYLDDTATGLADAPKIRQRQGEALRASINADAAANEEERRLIAEGDQ